MSDILTIQEVQESYRHYKRDKSQYKTYENVDEMFADIETENEFSNVLDQEIKKLCDQSKVNNKKTNRKEK